MPTIEFWDVLLLLVTTMHDISYCVSKKKIPGLARRLTITKTLVLSMTNSWITLLLNTILGYHHTPDLLLKRMWKILS